MSAAGGGPAGGGPLAGRRVLLPRIKNKDALAAGDVFTIQLKEEIPTRHVVLVQDGGRVPNAAAREFARMLNSSVTQQNAP